MFKGELKKFIKESLVETEKKQVKFVNQYKIKLLCSIILFSKVMVGEK